MIECIEVTPLSMGLPVAKFSRRQLASMAPRLAPAIAVAT
jgi:hypothetical protein